MPPYDNIMFPQQFLAPLMQRLQALRGNLGNLGGVLGGMNFPQFQGNFPQMPTPPQFPSGFPGGFRGGFTPDALGLPNRFGVQPGVQRLNSGFPGLRNMMPQRPQMPPISRNMNISRASPGASLARSFGRRRG